MPIRYNSQTGQYQQVDYNKGYVDSGLTQTELKKQWDRGQTKSRNLYGVGVGYGNRNQAGTSYININGVSMPIFGSLAGKARQSVGWNQGRESMSDFFNLGRSQSSGQYSSVNAMKQKLQKIMDMSPDRFKKNQTVIKGDSPQSIAQKYSNILNPRDRIKSQIYALDSQVNQLKNNPIVGRESLSGGKLKAISQSSGQKI